MTQATPGERLHGNAILARLPDRELQRVSERAEWIEAEIHHGVYEPGTPIPAVYFPITAVFSLVATVAGEQPMEIATIGREGMVGLPLFLGTGTSPHKAYCQVAGAAVRLSAADLHAVLRNDGRLHHLLNRCVQATLVQIAQSVLCNANHSSEQRAARWLLTTRDRVGEEKFALTQQFLAQMVGVRRPTVSEIAGRLQAAGLIRYSRGVVSILDRAGLEAAACPCYGIVKAEFDEMVG